MEIQIRSVAMDFWASLEHKIAYKFEGNAPEGLLRELKECADVVDMLDKKMFSLNEAITAYAKEHPEADIICQAGDILKKYEIIFKINR